MARPTVKLPANDTQKPLIGAARRCVDALVPAVKAALSGQSNAQSSDIRSKLTIVSTNDWDDFSPEKACNFPGIANRVYSKILAYRDGHDAVREQCASEITAALDALQAVLAAFGMPRSDHVAGEELDFFRRVDAELPLLKPQTGLARSIPQPDFNDFAAGVVNEPWSTVTIDKLKADGICLLQGKAAQGKTTAAMVTTFAMIGQGAEAFYLDLSDEQGLRYSSVKVDWLKLSCRTAALVIVDNAHRNPALVNDLVGRWRKLAVEQRCRLLIVTTDVSHSPETPDNARILLNEHRINVTVSATNLADIARFYVRRAAQGREVEIPTNVAANWSATFANHLHTFCFAVLERAALLGIGDNWALRREYALTWIIRNWLHRLDGHPIDGGLRQNLLCLSAFGDQSLELKVDDRALPNRGILFDYFQNLGVVRRSYRWRRGVKEWRSCLHEHGWGELIIEAAHDAETASSIQLAAMRRYPPLGIAVFDSLRILGQSELARCILAELVTPEFIENIAKDALNLVSAWLKELKQLDQEKAEALRSAVLVRLKTDPSTIADYSISQIVALKGEFSDKGARSDTSNASQFAIAIADAELDQNSTFLTSVGDSFVPTDLDIFYALPECSNLRASLTRTFAPLISASVDRALKVNLHQVTHLIQKIGQHLPDQVEGALDALSDGDIEIEWGKQRPPGNAPGISQTRKARLRNLAACADLQSFDNLNLFVQNSPTIDPRVGELFYSRFNDCRDPALVEDLNVHPAMAPWIIKALLACGRIEAAGDLAAIMMDRPTRLDDLRYGGKKIVEMIAQVCRACQDADRVQRYLNVMKIRIDQATRDKKKDNAVIADGLWALFNLDNVHAATVLPTSVLLMRASPDFARDPEPANSVRYLGVISNCLSAAELQPSIIQLLTKLPLETIVTHNWARPRADKRGDHAASFGRFQLQFWQAIYTIARSMDEPITMPSDVHADARKFLPAAIDDRRRNVPLGEKKLERRLGMIADWLETGNVAGENVRLSPPSKDLASV